MIAKYFSLDPGNQLAPYYVIYEAGDFLARHMDRAGPNDSDAIMKTRIVSIVIFLNDQCEQTGMRGYTGGNLNVFGLVDNEKFKDYGKRN